MKFKFGVTLEGVRPEIRSILSTVENLVLAAGIDFTITCTTGDHKSDDPHPNGCAIDFRTLGLTVDRCYQLAKDIQTTIGSKYYVQYEPQIVKAGKIIRGAHMHLQVRKDLWPKIIEDEKALAVKEVPNEA